MRRIPDPLQLIASLYISGCFEHLCQVFLRGSLSIVCAAGRLRSVIHVTPFPECESFFQSDNYPGVVLRVKAFLAASLQDVVGVAREVPDLVI